METYKTISGALRIRDIYGLSETAYKTLKKAGLPVYKSMSGSLNLRDSRSYTEKQIQSIKRIVENY